MWIFINGLSPTFHLMLHGKFVISAGSTRLRLSGFHSRAIERALAQLADLYVQKGHDLHSCRQALRKSWRSELPPPKGFLHPPLKRVRRLRPSVCVSTPVSKDFHFPFTTISIFVLLDLTTLSATLSLVTRNIRSRSVALCVRSGSPRSVRVLIQSTWHVLDKDDDLMTRQVSCCVLIDGSGPGLLVC